ncbi:hypothetical protein JCM33374_g3469 [Metschnikowia sp. JCM 33374]|nr:hypothetical protein JCM33374_g3469 [Metschnikowia sp. JCM 33374]
MDVLEDFLQKLQICTRTDHKQQPQKLLDLLQLNPQKNPFIVRINNLGYLGVSQVSYSVEKRNWFNGEWLAFDNLVISFVKLCNQMNPWSLLESFDLYTTYLNDITVAFMNKTRGYLVTPLLKEVLNQVLTMAKQLDYQMLSKEMYRKPRLAFMASILLKAFNNIRSQLGAEDHIEATKKSIMLFIGVKLCQTYFLLSNPLRCQDVFSNMNNANLIFGSYPPNQQLQYRYYLARFYMAKYEFLDAFEHLRWCLSHVPINYTIDSPNVTKILRDILPISILLGKRPKFGNFLRIYYSAPLKCPKFFAMYSDLASAIKTGNFSKLHDLINSSGNAEFLKQNGFASFFSSKAYLITLRNLVKSIWVTQGKKMRLEYDAVKSGLLLSLQNLDLTTVVMISSNSGYEYPMDRPLDDHAVENCLVTLIDQNFLRGKLFPRLRVVSLAKSEVFPDIPSTYFSKFGNGEEGILNSKDRWIGQN